MSQDQSGADVYSSSDDDGSSKTDDDYSSDDDFFTEAESVAFTNSYRTSLSPEI